MEYTIEELKEILPIILFITVFFSYGVGLIIGWVLCIKLTKQK